VSGDKNSTLLMSYVPLIYRVKVINSNQYQSISVNIEQIVSFAQSHLDIFGSSAIFNKQSFLTVFLFSACCYKRSSIFLVHLETRTEEN